MSDLVQWLRAQLDADERIARAATPGPWEQVPERVGWLASAEYWHVVDCSGTPAARENAAHVAEWGPARVLRETDAKRWFVEMLANSLKPNPTTGIPRGVAWSMLMRMAEPYRDRPGWLPYWPGSG